MSITVGAIAIIAAAVLVTDAVDVAAVEAAMAFATIVRGSVVVLIPACRLVAAVVLANVTNVPDIRCDNVALAVVTKVTGALVVLVAVTDTLAVVLAEAERT